jgi:flagellar biosynthesis GTPase FlhF
MAGRIPCSVIIAITLLFLRTTGASCKAEDAEPVPSPATSPVQVIPPFQRPSPGNNPENGGRQFQRNHPFNKGGDGFKNWEFSDQHKFFEHLPPEQQDKFRENFQRWQNMTQQEKNALREREALRRQKMLQEVDKAIKESGLQLDPQTRQMYVIRYTQERRAIEQALQKEMEAKRRPLVQDLTNRLNAEFKAMASPAPTAATSSSSPAPAPAATQ